MDAGRFRTMCQAHGRRIGLIPVGDPRSSLSTENENTWSDLLAILMYQGSMSYDQIMKSSVPFLLMMAPKIAETRITTAALSMGAGLGGAGSAAPQAQEVDSETFAAAINNSFA